MNLNDWNMVQTQNHLFRKQTPNVRILGLNPVAAT